MQTNTVRVRGQTTVPRKNDLLKIHILLKHFRDEPKNLMRLSRELKSDEGFKNCRSINRHLQVCLDEGFIEIAEVIKKWGHPTKIYRLTDKGRKFLSLLNHG